MGAPTAAGCRIALCTALKTQLSTCPHSPNRGVSAGHHENGLLWITAERRIQEYSGSQHPVAFSTHTGGAWSIHPLVRAIICFRATPAQQLPLNHLLKMPLLNKDVHQLPNTLTSL